MRDRQEPTMGQPDLSNVNFATAPQATRRPANTTGLSLIAKIAIGVFLGLCLFLLITCSLFVVGASAVAEQQEQQQQAAIAQFQRAVNDPDPMGFQREIDRRRRAEAAAKALQPGERCIEGKRFRRVENGWVQVDRPC